MTTLTKPPADRLYGRVSGHKLRPKQHRLLDITLPRLRFPIALVGDPRRAFRVAPERLALEVGFGGGEHALAQVAADPGMGLIACEVFDQGLCSLLSRLVAEDADEAVAPLPDTLRVWDDDARILLRDLPPGCLDMLFLMFPDPWPKARHAKRRFVHPGQVAMVARVVRPGGVWRVASDDPTYQAWVSEVMAEQDFFVRADPVTTRPDGWPPTRYEAKALRAGRTPFYWCFVRTETPYGHGGLAGSMEFEG
jgi:tRNA (guanine-N7-)-methyltransferase